MKVLVVGSGGREHALAWKLSKSPRVTEVLCAPGNPGTARLGRNFPIPVTDLDGIVAIAVREGVGLVVVGPEAPLCLGLADKLRAAGIPVFGPSAVAARIEGSKAFSKQVMAQASVPTATYKTFTKLEDAESWVTGAVVYPMVVKASGLAAGKGVVICRDEAEAIATLRAFLADRTLGDAGATVVVEDFLSGEEISVFCVTDGATLFALPASQDHKRVGEGDTGPNTGGMGAYSPTPFATDAVMARIEREVLVPTVHAMSTMDCPFSGLLFAGMMLTRGGPRTLEFNCRFGDPETQVVLPRLKGDLLELLLAVANGSLEHVSPSALEIDPRAAVTVVLASGGYPGAFAKGFPITGVEKAEALPDVLVFHAGTAFDGAGRLVTAGGRVLAVTALGADFAEARRRAYEAVGHIAFEGMYFRKDIGARASAARGGSSA